LPLSFAQERLWLLYQLEPENPIYNKSIIQRLKGPLNVAALEQSLNEILRRHEVLRTTLPRLTPTRTWHLSVTDCRPFSEPETEARRRVSEEIQNPFDLTRGPLLRTHLLRLGTEDYVLVLITHQICFDDQSRGILIQELMALYEAFSTGKPSPLPELPVQYADFAHWQRQWFKGEVLEKQLAYWREQLNVRVPRLNLSANRRGSAAYQTIEIPTHLYKSLRALSQREGVTLFVTLLAAFQTLLFRYTKQEDILVFSSTGGRNRSEIKGLIGLFANLLALRTDLSGNPPFRELLSRVREVALGAYSHQDLPFDKLVEMLHSGQTHGPLFQVLFVLQNASVPSLSFSGLRVEPFRVNEEGTSQFDLVLYFKETAEGLTAWLRYKTELFEAATRMVGDFRTLLEGIVANPSQRLLDLPCLTEDEQLSLFGEPMESDNNTKANFQAPRDALEGQLVNIWKKVLRRDSVGIEDNFFDLGGDSLLAINLFAEIEKRVGKQIPLASLLEAPTVGQLAELLRHEGWSPPWTSLVAVQPRGAKPPFFYVPPAASTALSAVKYARYLGTEQPVYGLQPLGFEEGEVPHSRVEDMAAYYIREIRSFQPEGPYYLGGTCFGGYVAFEMAQQLRAQGCSVALLALFDPSVPGQTGSVHTRPKNVFNLPAYFIRRTLHHFNHGRLFHALMGFFVYRHYRRFKLWLKGKINSKIKSVMDAHRTAQINYIPQVYPGKITLFQSSEIHALEKKGFWAKRWSDLASGGFDCHVIEGNHLEIFREPRIQELVKQLKVCLDEAQQDVLRP
jgi:thioesterase domain-containing protein/acyl carrier protein